MRRPSSLRVTPLSRFGAEVVGTSLRSSLANEPVAAQVRQALDEHGLLVFRGQSDLKPEHHVALGSWFGSVFPLPSRFQHPRAPHADVLLRVSNAESEGLVGVGTTGWHMDGLSYATPFGVALLHIAEVPRRGPTLFLPLHPLVETLRRQQPGWERLSMRCGTGKAAVHHPLLFAHPRSPARFGVCLGKTSGLVRDRGTAQESELGEAEAEAALAALDAHVAAHAAAHTYAHEWRAGDTLLVDNLQVAHLAPPETMLPPEEIGLRVLHRVVVAGVEGLRGIAGTAAVAAAAAGG